MNAALNNNIRIFTGNSVPELAHKICDHLSLPLGQAMVSTFSDGEIRVEIADNVRGRDVFLIQSTCPPTNHNLMELLHHDRRGETGLGPADHRGHPLFRLCPPGPQGGAPGAHHRQAGGRPAVHRRGPAHSHHGPARGPDPGLFRYSGGQPLRLPHHDSLYPGKFSGRPGHRLARMPAGCPGPGPMPSAWPPPWA